MSSAPFLAFFHLIESLKTQKRTGWLKSGIPDAESIADHMYRMALMAMSLPSANLKFYSTDKSTFKEAVVDKERCLKMALVHDLSEAIVGDITPHCGVSKEEKRRLEVEAIAKIVDMVKDVSREFSESLYSLWHEYEDGVTLESILVHDLDKFEMIVQADEYERRHGQRYDSFWESTRDVFRTDIIKRWADDLREERAKRIK